MTKHNPFKQLILDCNEYTAKVWIDEESNGTFSVFHSVANAGEAYHGSIDGGTTHVESKDVALEIYNNTIERIERTYGLIPTRRNK